MRKKFISRGWCSPERYIQGAGELNNLEFYTDKFGKIIVFFIDGFLFSNFKVRIEKLYRDNEHKLFFEQASGEVTEQYINAEYGKLQDMNVDVVVGIGGGKTIDIAKAVGFKLKKRFIIVPTIAATDAPTSSLSVLYSPDGEHVGEYFYDHSPSLVLVDSEIIAHAPSRFLVSGMGDALSTMLEAKANGQSNTPNLVYHSDGGYGQTIAGRAIAQACFDTIMKYGVLAKQACDANVVTDALEKVIEANILLSGVGFENNDTAGAHSINDGLTAVENSNLTMHGEKVSFGCIVQLFAQSASKEFIDQIIDFCLEVGLPVCLSDLHVTVSDDNIRKIAEKSMHSNWSHMPFAVNSDVVFASIKTADSYGASYKERWNKKNG